MTDGTFTSVDTTGIVTGNTYTQSSGDWEVIAYSAASPTPTPSVTATPVPTATPAPTPVPTASPVMVTEYIGEYTVSAFSGAGIAGPYTAAATNGCFFLILTQPVGGTIGQSHARRPLAGPSPNAFGDGEPNEPGTEAETFLDEGTITSFTITGLTLTSGTGSFTFTNSSAATATGAVTITGSESSVGSPDAARRRIDSLRRPGALIVRSRR